MRINLLSFILFLLTTYSFGQISFQKGYFIDNENRKTECLIKNMDWKNNPIEFTYKLEESGTPEKGNISSVKEFGIYDVSKYIRSNTKIDRSNDNINSLSYERLPIWSQEILFLKVLVEGKASLFYYEEGSLKRFFYSVSDTSINQLIYKRYIIDYQKMYEDHLISKEVYEKKKLSRTTMNAPYNNTFRQQLWKDVGGENVSVQYVEKIEYNTRDLEKYFIDYNQGSGIGIVKKYNKPKSGLYKFKITPGYNLSSVSLKNSKSEIWNLDFKSNTSFRLGLESEFILPFNKNKWGLIIEPTFEYFNSEMKTNTDVATIDYNTIEFPIGIRYHIYMNEDLKIFFNGIWISNMALTFNSNVRQDYESVLDITSARSYAVGGGIEYKKFSFEVRCHTNKQLLGTYSLWTTDYPRISFIVGYTIFQNRK
jgi:hypothetical protein